jgi:hypothetical protein
MSSSSSSCSAIDITTLLIWIISLTMSRISSRAAAASSLASWVRSMVSIRALKTVVLTS